MRRLVLLTVLMAVAACGDARPRPSAPASDPLGEVEGAELYRRGLALARASHFVRAEQYFTAAMARGVPEEQVLPALIRVCVASSRLRAALSHAEPYLQRNPSAWSLRYLVASLHLGLGEIDRARRELERVIRDAPDEPQAYYLLGRILRDEVGDRPGAARRFARYLELAPGGEHADEVQAALEGLQSEDGAASGGEAGAAGAADQDGNAGAGAAAQDGAPAHGGSAAQSSGAAPASAPAGDRDTAAPGPIRLPRQQEGAR